MTIKEFIVSLGYKVDGKSEKKANDSVKKFGSCLKKFATVAGAMKIGKELVKIADAYTQIANKLRYATQGAEDLAAAQLKITDTAKDTKSTYQDIAGVAATMLNSRNALVPDLDTANDYTEMIVKAFRAAGESNEQAIANARSVARSFTTGVLNGGVVQDAMVNAPEIIDYLAEYFGTSAQGVKARANYIRVEDFIKALKANKEGIENSFGQLDTTLDDVKNVIKNDVGEMATNIVGSNGDVAEGLKNAWEAVAPILKSLSEILGAVFDILGKLLSPILKIAEWAANELSSGFKAFAAGFTGNDEYIPTTNPEGMAYDIGRSLSPSGIADSFKPLWDDLKDIFGFAEGGVIEPNNPHAVIVGDNKQEREIISPLSTMRRAVSEAMLNMRGNLAAVNGAKVTQYFTITNTFHGGAESAQTQGAAVMTRVERDIIGDLADVMQMI